MSLCSAFFAMSHRHLSIQHCVFRITLMPDSWFKKCIKSSSWCAFWCQFTGNVHVSTSCHCFQISNAVQCSAVQCSAVQCSAVQCSAVQCNAWGPFTLSLCHTISPSPGRSLIILTGPDGLGERLREGRQYHSRSACDGRSTPRGQVSNRSN